MLKTLLIITVIAFIALVTLRVLAPDSWIHILGVASLGMFVVAPIILIAVLVLSAVRKRRK